MCMRRNRNAGFAMCACTATEYLLDGGRHTGSIGCALDHASFDAGIGDPLADIAHEHLRHEVFAAAVEVMRQYVERIEPRCNDDVEADLIGNCLDAWNVAPEPKRGRIENRVDTGCFQFVQP